MDKGVSPVVAVVLLIAIAVVAAAGVWFWVAPMITQSQSSSSVADYAVSITNCRTTLAGGNVSVRVTGSKKTPSTATEISIYKNDDDTFAGNITLASLTVGSYDNDVEFHNRTAASQPFLTGTYYIADETFAKTYFSC